MQDLTTYHLTLASEPDDHNPRIVKVDAPSDSGALEFAADLLVMIDTKRSPDVGIWIERFDGDPANSDSYLVGHVGFVVSHLGGYFEMPDLGDYWPDAGPTNV